MYINSVIVQNKNSYILKWLLLITFLVILMIIIGGLTRLTDSGLSITKWELFTGIIPPLTMKDWNDTFNLYKKIPEFQIENPLMTLDEFKIIFWWEYIHRLLGRFVGIFYLIPLLIFTFTSSLKKKTLFHLYLIFILICFQGFIGWFMVKSGLTENTDVSHYRLSLHLTLAFIILILLVWNYLKIKFIKPLYVNSRLNFLIPLFFLFCVILQISVGAFVSGLDAGKIYQTWPLMGYDFFPNDSSFRDLLTYKAFNTPSLVQFLHRNIAYFIFFQFLLIFYFVFKSKYLFYLRDVTLYVLTSLIIQIFLGILTILSGANIVIASLHQIGSIFLVITSLMLFFKNYKTNLQPSA